MHCHRQRVVHIVIEVGARADDKIDETILHQRNQASSQTRRCERACQRHTNGHVVLWREHFFDVETRRLVQTGRVIGLELRVNEFSYRHIGCDPVG